MNIYYNFVGHGTALFLNIAPDITGRIPEFDAKRAAEFGAEIKRHFGKSIAQTKGKGKIMEMSLDNPTTIDYVITMEDITQGRKEGGLCLEVH